MTTELGFKKAVRSKDERLRLALMGSPKSGKTMTALRTAAGMDCGPVAVIDTERGSASKYANMFDFDVLELTNFSPRSFVAAIAEAAKAKYSILIIDSMSHEWVGPGGVLDIVDKLKADVKAAHLAWSKATPLHNQFIEAILEYPGHVITTIRMRHKIEVSHSDNGKLEVKKIGYQPVQRDDVEFEMDIIGTLNSEDNSLSIENMARYACVRGYRSDGPATEDFGKLLMTGLNK